MKPEIKERIAQVRRGAVPYGYKKQTAGIFPQSWGMFKFTDAFVSLSSRNHQIPKSQYLTKGKYPVIDQGKKKIIGYSNNLEKVLKCPPSGVIVFGDHTREIKYIDFDFIIGADGTQLLLGQNDIALTIYLFYFLTIQNIPNNGYGRHLKFLKSIDFILPPLEEQRRIAEILTAQDKIIALKERRLAEKRRQKTGLAQRLLTGKTRLPGFDDKWRLVRANEIFKNVSNKKHDGSLEVLSATQDRGIIPRSQVEIDIKYDPESLTGYKKVEKGNFVISLRSFQGGIEYSEYEGIVSPAYTVLSAVEPIADNYYRQFFKSADYINRLNIAVYGIRDGKQIGYADFGRIKVPYPPLAEQQAIAEVLTCADREIAALQRDLELEKRKKKALMQLLLTGVVRVNSRRRLA